MDFITSLPPSRGFTTIMVVVDRLTKYAHFAPLPPRFDAWRVANLFIDTVVKHHGFPKTLVSDRDPLFLNEVWESMLRLSGTKLNFTTAYHPQSDGQTEVRNRGLEQYLRAFVADRPVRWTNFLPWAELALNCFHHEGLGTSPFRALYGREPPLLIAAAPSATTPPNVAETIRQRGEMIVTLRQNLEKAQQRMRSSANRHRREVNFAVGDRVLLKLQQYRQHSVAKPLSAKLARRFYGPFEVVERIGPVAYRLKLPPGSRIHDVFHVSLFRPFVEGAVQEVTEYPSLFARGKPVARPIKLQATRSVMRGGSMIEEGLILWDDDGGQQPSWEPLPVIRRRFPDLLLADKEALNTGGVDTSTSAQEASEVPEPSGREEYQVFETVEREPPQDKADARNGRPRRESRRPVRYGEYVSR